MSKVVVYGAYGYTGRLIVDDLFKRGITPEVAGRNHDKIAAFASVRSLSFKSFPLEDTRQLCEFLSGASVCIHCAGPFTYTASPMVSASSAGAATSTTA